MANNKIRFLRGTSAEYEASSKDKDTFYYTTDMKKLYLGSNEVTGSDLSIDEIIDDTSTTATDKTYSIKKIKELIPTASTIDILSSDPTSPSTGYMWISKT